MVIIFFPNHPSAETYAAPLVAGQVAGHGFVQLVGDHVYLFGADNRATAAQKAFFSHVVVVGEGASGP